jgi:ankyrin repeat protein
VSDFSIYSLPELIRSGDLAAVEAALESGADVNSFERGFSALSAAASINAVELVRKLIALGANVPHPEEDTTALHEVAIVGSPEMIQILLDAGEEVNVQDSDGNTPLIWAVGSESAESVEAVRLLLSRGADPSIHNFMDDNGSCPDGESPLYLVTNYTKDIARDAEIIELLQTALSEIESRPGFQSESQYREPLLSGGAIKLKEKQAAMWSQSDMEDEDYKFIFGLGR